MFVKTTALGVSLNKIKKVGTQREKEIYLLIRTNTSKGRGGGAGGGGTCRRGKQQSSAKD